MPKAAPNSNPSRPALRRNQACRSCRRRKLKCDAARPHCGTCLKQWQALVSVPAPIGYAHPTEPQCSYDPVEGLSLAQDTDPTERVRQLEDEVARLKNQLFEREHLGLSRSITPNQSGLHVFNSPASESSIPNSINRPTSSASNKNNTSTSQAHGPVSMMNLLTPESPPERDTRNDSSSPQLLSSQKPGADPFMDLLFSGWNPDLPDPPTLNHYVDVFFRCDPCGSRVLHRPSFLASMLLSPRDPGFPHSAILHAICAAASRWSPQNVVTMPDGTRRDQFAEFHASKTRQYIDKTMASGEDIFSVMQACILLAWYFYQEGRWVEVWIFAAFQTRVAIPLRLNYPGTFSTHGINSPGAFLAPPKDLRDLEMRRRTWWMTILFDRIVSVGGWIHSVDERDLGTELPLRTVDFESEAAVASNPQDILTPDVFTRHPAQYTDPFLLLIKAVMLFGRVTDYNVRGTLRAPTAPSKNQNPFFLDGFEALDRLVCQDFLERLPQMYKNNNGVTDSNFDTDLYMVHIVPHAAAITLHNPFIDFTNSTNVSTSRCIVAARAILSAYYTLTATSLDITRLHPFITICWYLAAVVQVQLCKYFIEINDNERESTVWGDINVLRFALLEYGQRSPVGSRQERLLQGLMREIVRLTGQKQPLQVGVPLFPFSHTTVFKKDQGGNQESSAENLTQQAPLPSISPSIFDNQPSSMRQTPVLNSSRMADTQWPVSERGLTPPNHLGIESDIRSTSSYSQ